MKFSLLALAVVAIASNVALADYGGKSHHHHHGSSPHCRRDLSSLRLLITVFRYGDISPVITFPNDIYQEESWPTGFGQLTRRGVERTFELGQWMRNCYGSFLPKNVSPQRVYARSTDYDRTLMSAQSVLAGVYPPASGFQTSSQKWGETCAYKLGQLWQPFPVHTVPAKYDRLLRGNLNCPRFEELTNEIDDSKKARKMFGRHKEFIEKLIHKSGIKADDHVKLVSIVESAVLAEVENGRVPVAWLDTERDIELLAYFRDLIVRLYFENEEVAKLLGGKLLQEILDRMFARASGDSKLEHIMYSGHSTVMEALLASLGVLKYLGWREPPYASAVIFELHKMPDHSFAVAAFYRNSSTHDPIPLMIPGCYRKYESSESEESESESESESSIGMAEPGDTNPAGIEAMNTQAGNAGEELISRRKRDVTDFMFKNKKQQRRVSVDKRQKAKQSKSHQNKKKQVKQSGSHDKSYNKHRKRRLTLCKLKDFKKALIKKCTRQHDIDCRAKHVSKKRVHQSASKASSSSSKSDEIGHAQPMP